MLSTVRRRGILREITGVVALRCRGSTAAQGLALPSPPVTLNVLDVAGNLQLTHADIERFRQQTPKLVSRISFSRAPSPGK